MTLPENEKQELERLRAKEATIIGGSELIVAFRQTPSRSREALIELEVIRPYAEELIAKSMGEQEWGFLHRDVLLGYSDLFMCYIVKNQEDKKILEDQGDVREKEFAAYVYITYQYGATTAHFLHVYIQPKFRHLIMKQGLEYLKNLLKQRGVKRISMSTLRQGWADVAPTLGFTETFTTYRMDI